MSHHAKKVVDQLCSYLGYDLDSPMCKELHEHIQQCPECRDYVDSVKMTVKVYQDCQQKVEVPEAVKMELFKKLNLNIEKASHKKK